MSHREPQPEEMALIQRRATVVAESKQAFVDEASKEKSKKNFSEKFDDFKKTIYNAEKGEFVGRNTRQCFLLSVFYFIFYLIMSGAFVGLLAIFSTTIDPKVPRYYDETSSMHLATVNPGLGFRPHYDPESSLIRLNISEPKVWKEEYTLTINRFLKKYDELKDKSVRISDREDRIVSFDYSKIIENTGCSRENDYGMAAGKPCIILKMNKIFGWRPRPLSEPPTEFGVNIPESVKTGNKTNYLDRYVYVRCQGREAFDKDNIGKIKYFSLFPNNEIGGLPAKYYPYRNQENYLSPLIFVQFESLTKNALIGVECKAYARNIDNDDRRNQRGMARFDLFLAP
jgi:sodium/potassium-transporting ATPase subunit beta